MANIKKSFNFRNGVQVDDDNFIVNSNGLVGIGSTVPTELLDVGGNVRIRGTLYAESIAGKIINTASDGTADFTRITVGITTITSGIITATSGIITYYGDGSKLQGLPTSQWVDVDPALNLYTSIYSQGNVGIATTNPIYSLQIGGNYSIPFTSRGVGIGSNGNIEATGNIGIGSNLYVTGITTSYSFSGFGTNITGINASNITNGILNSNLLSTNINQPSGIGTFNLLYANLVGIATTALNLAANANIDISSINSGYSNLGVTTATTLDASTISASTSIGIGTDSPNSELHLRKNGSDTNVQITSDSDTAKIIIGNSVVSTDNNTIIQFNDTSISKHPESGENCFDIINYAPGNFNNFIRPESTPDLKFNWINHSISDILMSLTSDGHLGLGKTNPTETFEVVGTSTVTSNSFIGGDFSVSGNITGGSLNIYGTSSLKSTTIIGSVGIFANSPNYTLQVGNDLNALGIGTGVGISSSGDIVATGIVTASKFVGIGSNITLLKPENISSGTITNVSINASSGVVTTGILTATTLYGEGSNITLLKPENISSGTFGDNSYLFENDDVKVGIGTTNTNFATFSIRNTGFISGITTFISQSGISTNIDQTYIDTYKLVEYTIHIEYSGYVQTEKVIITNDNVGTMYTTYGSISTPSKVVEIDASTVGGFSRLEVIPKSGINGLTTCRFFKKVIFS